MNVFVGQGESVKLKVLENQSYIAGTDMVFLDYLEKELDRLSTEFSRVLPADTASGLVAHQVFRHTLALTLKVFPVCFCPYAFVHHKIQKVSVNAHMPIFVVSFT